MFASHYEALFVLMVLAVWCWVDVWPRGNLNPGQPQRHRTDFTVYTEAGKAAIAGNNPYSVSNARGWTYLYLPPFALLVSPLAFLPEGLQCALWFWISIACLYGTIREFSTLDRWAFPKTLPQNASRLATWGGLVCVFGFSLSTLNCLQRGQVGILQLYLTLLGTRMVLVKPSSMSAFFGGIVLACAVILKLSPALPAIVLLLGLVYLGLTSIRPQQILPISPTIKNPFSRPLWMAGGVAVGIALGVWILPACLLGWEPNQTYLNTWRREVLSRTKDLTTDPFAGNSHSVKNQSPMNGFWLLGNKVLYTKPQDSEPNFPMDLPAGQVVLATVRWMSLLLTAIALIAIVWRGNDRDLLVAFALANAATLLVVPIARGHYFMAMWPATIWLPRWLWQFPTQSVPLYVQLLAYLPPVLLILHYLLERQLASYGILGVGIWIWLLLLTFAVVLSKRRHA